MKLSTKILILIGVLSVIFVTGYIIYKQNQIYTKQESIEKGITSQKQLIDDITRSQSGFTTKKELEQFIKDNKINYDAINDDLKLLHAEVKSINVVKVVTPGYVATNVATTGNGTKNIDYKPPVVKCPDGPEVPCPNADPFEYQKNEKNLTIVEPFENNQVPIGTIGFSAWKEKPWRVEIKPREYSVTTVIGRDENEKQYFYNKFSISVDGKQYDVKINSARAEETYPDPKFFWWAPRIRLGIDSGYSVNNRSFNFVPGLDFGFLAYGKYRTQPDWYFANIGVGLSQLNNRLEFTIIPFTYNIGKHLPFMNNMYIGPSIGSDMSGNVSIMATIKVGL